MSNALIDIRDLGVAFRGRTGRFGKGALFWGVKQACLTLNKGDSFCLIGESGSGKSTLALAMTGLLPFRQGHIIFKGNKISKSRDNIHRTLIKQTQMVFQDPVQALSPFRPLGRSIEEPLAARGISRQERERILAPLIRDTGLSKDLLRRRPAQASGGQNQRVCIARSLATMPELLILDEPLTALDSLIKNRITDLLCRIKEKYPITFFIITHDMALVKAMATRVGVIYLGRILETAPKETILTAPAHPYTQALLAASFTPGIWKGKRLVLEGDAPSAMNLPRGCIFHTRCPRAFDLCRIQVPEAAQIGKGHIVSCHLYSPPPANTGKGDTCQAS